MARAQEREPGQDSKLFLDSSKRRTEPCGELLVEVPTPRRDGSPLQEMGSAATPVLGTSLVTRIARLR